eukprot:gene1795-2355_t
MHGDYLAIVTLGFGEIIRLVLNNWLSFTGGPNGMPVPSPTFLGLEFGRRAQDRGVPFHEFFGFAYHPNLKFLFIYVVLFLVVMLVLYGERRARGASRPSNERPRGKALYHLSGFKAAAATGWCALVFACAFVIPMLQLLAWFWQRGRFDLDERYAGLIVHTLYLGGMAALITVSVALLLAFANRLAPTRAIRAGVSLGNLGYALPGSVLAVSIMLAFSYLDRELVIPVSSWLGGAGKPLLLGSLSALLMAYLVRFLAVAYGPLENSLARIRPSLPEAARSLG